jgi:hypothetical protein
MNNIMSFANKMCMRKKTIDDFIVLKPRDDVDINTRLPKVRDYQSEITKRVLASEPKTGDDCNHDADSFD